jgi:hypothetical protein
MKSPVLLLIVAVSAFAAEPAKPQPKPAPAPQTTATQTAPRKPSVSDAEIERAFKARLAKSKVVVNDLQVRVNNGIATLEGRVNVIQHKGAATRMAKSSGARAVINNIKISEAARQKAGQQMARARKAQVKSE